MKLDPRKSPAVFSLLCAGLTLLVALALPVWTLMGTSRPHLPVWAILDELSENMSLLHSGYWTPLDFLTIYQSNLIVAAVAFAGGGILGRALYWWRWERR